MQGLFTFLFLVIVTLIFLGSLSKVEARDPENPYCKSAPIAPFCPQGVPLPSPVPETDQIEVYYLEAPVFEFVFGNLFEKLKWFHGAIGLKNLRTNASYTLEYDAMYEVGNATFPYIISDPNTGEEELLYCNDAALCWMNGINSSYWIHGITKMTVINGTLFNILLKWLPIENETYSTRYFTWDVFEKEGGILWIPSYTCVDFVWRFFGVLLGLNVKFEPNIHPRHDMINIYGNKPVRMDYSDPTVRKKIVNYWSKYQFKGKSKIQIAELLAEWLISDKFYLSQDGFYYYIQAKYPYMNWRYVEIPIEPVYIDMSFLNDKDQK